MVRCSFAWLLMVLAGAGGSSGSGDPTNAVASIRLPDESLFPQGRFVYERNCLICHGKWGDGRGELGTRIVLRPRKFTTGVFKYRTTPTGMLPTDADLQRTIRQGIYGTAMPSFAALPRREIEAVAEYLKSFSSKWRKPGNRPEPLTIPRPPEWFGDAPTFAMHANSGRTLFVASCAPCHGEAGRGDGPSAAQLTDDWEQPVKPADLSLPSLRSGPELSDVYKVLVTGLNGTPMPSFLDATSEAERWDLVAYIESLRRAAQEAASVGP
jgi:cytochrome c oxidase cbb3-type subunit 2